MNDRAYRDARAPSMTRVPIGAFLVGALLVLLAAFVAGRCSKPLLDSVTTIRQAEAAPVPRALPENVVRFHDASEDVTCWVVVAFNDPHDVRGVSCLPNQWLASARLESEH